MNKLSKILFVTLFVIGAGQVFGQDGSTAEHEISIEIPEVAILDIEGGASIILKAIAPDEAGNPITFGVDPANTPLWLNYSSIIGSGESDASRNITVELSDGSIPEGMKLSVTAGDAVAGEGDGTKGSSVGAAVEINGTPVELINTIGSCYTGDGVGKGHKLTYALDFNTTSTYSALDFNDATTIKVLYTILDN